MKNTKIKSSISQQEITKIDYASKIFPHITTPSKKIKVLSECLWELFSYGTLSPKNLNLIQLLLDVPDFNSMNNREKIILIQAYKTKVSQIKRYAIDDEELIFAILKDITLQRLNYLQNQDHAIITELVKNPLLTNTEIQKRIELSRTYIYRRRKQLINDGVINIRQFVDPHYFGLSHYLFIFTTKEKQQHTFEELFMQNPYLMSMKKSYIYNTKETEVLYLLSLYIPHKQEKQLSAWVNHLKHYGLVSGYFLLEVSGFAHSVNLHQLNKEKEKWDFDISRDVILSSKFARENQLILSLNDYFKHLKYRDRIRNTFSQQEILVASLLSEKPYLTLSDLKSLLDKYDVFISKAGLSKVKKNLNDVMLPYISLDSLGLGTTLIIFIWEPFLSEDENDFLTKYFAGHFPQTTFNFSKDGLCVAVEIPSNGETTRNVLLNLLRKHYSDSIALLTPRKFQDKPLSRLMRYWDKNKRTWMFEDWMLPDVDELIKNR